MSNEASSASGLSLEGVDDVQDFVWANEEDTMSWERFSHLYDLMQIGNIAFRENRFQELALKDAEKAMNFQNNSIKPYILKADALILLERFELAHDVILSGLQVDPLSIPLQNLSRITTSIIGRRSHGIPQRSDDFDCTLCLKLLYEPLTTPCGHSFCRSCLFQVMDRGNRCPLCRTVLFISPRTSSISVTLNNIIQKNFPEEYAERKLEHNSLTNLGVDLMPLFVMDVVLPCQKLQLNIFEARYRLMVRRIMEGNRRMGMVIIDSTTGLVADFACEVEITDCEPLPDGRFFLEVESRRRCRILRNWDQDGYRVAEIEWVQDICPAEGTRERLDLQDMINNAAAYARSWMSAAQQAAQGENKTWAPLYESRRTRLKSVLDNSICYVVIKFVGYSLAHV